VREVTVEPVVAVGDLLVEHRIGKVLQLHAPSTDRWFYKSTFHISEIVSDPKAQGPLTPSDAPTQAKTRLEWATGPPAKEGSNQGQVGVPGINPRPYPESEFSRAL
jgi:hypothetical protein